MKAIRTALVVLAGLAVLLALGKDMLRLGKRTSGPPETPLRFELVEASSAVGLIHVHRMQEPHPSLANLGPWLMSLSASVAVADYDGDGWRDIYLTNAAAGSKNRLFRNDGDGTFTDVAERAGVADLNRKVISMGALFFDFDNDGDKDLLVTSDGPATLLANKGDGTFEDATERSELRHRGMANAANVLDYDLDGDLDLVLGDYFKPVDLMDPVAYDIMQSDVRYGDNGGRAYVYRNDGDGTFSPAPGNLGIETPRWVTAIGVYDLFGDGWPDLHFCADYNPQSFYINKGNGRLLNASASLADFDGMNTMDSDFADPFNKGETLLYVSNAYLYPFERNHSVLWRISEDGEFRDLAEDLGVEKCGWCWGGKFVDLDNDTLQDLVVVNGYISGDPDKEYRVTVDYFKDKPGGMADTRNWPPMGDSSMYGHQRGCVFLNDGERFWDVAGRTGMKDDRLDGRGLALIDHLNDGSLSLVVANQGQPARFYRNVQRNDNKWIGFELEGSRSNRDAFGAEVKVRLKGGTVLTRQLQPANGYAGQSDDRLHFGLGRDPVIEEVSVRWPAGGRQKLEGLEPGRYHKVIEPGSG